MREQWRIIPALIWTLLIAYYSMQGQLPLETSRLDFLTADKFGHFVAYAVLGALLFWGLRFRFVSRRNCTFWALSLSIGFGLLMEIVQGQFFPSRQMEWGDALANAAGALTGTLIIAFFLK